MAKLFAHSHQGCNICKYKLMASLNASNWCENPSTEFVSPQGYIHFWFYSFVITKRIRTKNPNLTQWWVNIACLVGFKLLWLNRSLVFSSKSPIYYHIAVSVFTICAQGMGAIIGNVESWKQMLKCQDDKSTFSRLTPICESQNVPFLIRQDVLCINILTIYMFT